jgi:DnaD/phage-associated family protein
MPKVSIFFSHDTNASQDPKILQMCTVYKSEGYGWFWMLVEKMAEQENYKIPIDGKYTIDAYAMRMYCDSIALHKFIDDCVKEFKLFQTDGKFLWSESLNRRMQYFEIKSEIGKKAALARWNKRNEQSDSNANAMQTQSDGNTNKQNKQKEINKINDINKDASKKEFSETLKEMVKIYEQEIGGIATPMIAEKIRDIEQEYNLEIFKAGLKRAVNGNHRNLNYAIEIMKDYKVNGIPSGNGSKPQIEQPKPFSKFHDGWNTGL